MRFGGPLPWHGPLAQHETLRRFALESEVLGYEWVTAGEHLIYPKHLITRHPRTGSLPLDPSEPSLEMFTLFAWLAAQTESLRFMSSMLILPYRSPFVTAKLVTGLDFVSGGRFTFGTACGWMAEEFDALNVPFRDRGKITDEYLLIIEALITSGGPFEGEYYTVPESWFEPKPIQQRLPIIIGGRPVAAVLRRVARHGAGWSPWPLTAEEIKSAMPAMRQAWKEAGRAGEPIEIHATARVEPNRPLEAQRDDLLREIARHADAGVSHLSMAFGELGGMSGPPDADAISEAMAWFAERVIAEVGGDT